MRDIDWNELDRMIESLGTEPTSPASGGTTEEWFAHASGRPAFQLWGKAHEGQPWPAHPLLCHMLDVAAVAARLLTRVLPRSVARRLLSFEPNSERALRVLLLTIALHDLGKATPAFQAKVEPLFAFIRSFGFDAQVEKGDLHHSDAGFHPVREALVRTGFENLAAGRLSRAVTAHHGQFPTNVTAKEGRSSRQLGRASRWSEARTEIERELSRLFACRVDSFDGEMIQEDHAYIMLLAGLTSVADWVGSMSEVFSYEAPPTSLSAYWSVALRRADKALAHAGMPPAKMAAARAFAELFPFTPWPLHEAVDALAKTLTEPSLVIVEAPMGEGKTEAALLLASSNAARAEQQGFYIGLPTQATANQMFGRVQRFLERTRPGEAANLLLAHGEASLVEAFDKVRLAAIYDRDADGVPREGKVRAEQWFLSKKRTLLAEYAVGTIDQTLMSVMRVGHGFVRLYGLAGKTVILDEVHAYDTYTGTLMERLVEWLASVGASVVLLSATLPSQRRNALARSYSRGRGLTVESEAPRATYPRITVTTGSRSFAHGFSPRSQSARVRLDRCDVDVRSVIQAALSAVGDGGCVGCIFNTVQRAQEAFEILRTERPDVDRLLLHARLLPDDRLKREATLEAWLGPEQPNRKRPARAVVVGTQVLEQSLDVDFDVLFTDLAPIDLVLQRSGRLFRHNRSNRSARHVERRLVVARPELSDAGIFKDIAIVYSELIVQRSFEVLASRDHLVIPDEIEAFVERVYDATEIPAPGDAVYESFLDHFGRARSEQVQAEIKLLTSPSCEDDLFGDFKVFLDEDDDPALHEQLRAATRLGRPTVEIVCVERSDRGLHLGDEMPFDLEATPDRAGTARLVRRSIGVTRFGLVQALTAEPAVKAWEDSPLLRYRRPVVFEQGRASVGGVELALDPELGLVITTSAKGKR